MNDSRRQATLYLDDLVAGARFRSDEFVLDEAGLKAFAAQFVPQPFHLDDEAARQTLFGGLAASGWHTAAITMRLLVTSGMPLADGLIGAGGEIDWPRPMRAGGHSACGELHPGDHTVAIQARCGIVALESLTLNQRGEVVQRLLAKLVVFRRPA
ncbi:MaoC/PaaZ C-terminal domain-containing protein [Azotobacter armeniacus]